MRVRIGERLKDYLSLLSHGIFLLSQEQVLPYVPKEWGPHKAQPTLHLSADDAARIDLMVAHHGVSASKIVQAALFLAATRSRLQPAPVLSRVEMVAAIRAGATTQVTQDAKAHGQAAAVIDASGNVIGYVPANILVSLVHHRKKVA